MGEFKYIWAPVRFRCSRADFDHFSESVYIIKNPPMIFKQIISFIPSDNDPVRHVNNNLLNFIRNRRVHDLSDTI